MRDNALGQVVTLCDYLLCHPVLLSLNSASLWKINAPRHADGVAADVAARRIKVSRVARGNPRLLAKSPAPVRSLARACIITNSAFFTSVGFYHQRAALEPVWILSR